MKALLIIFTSLLLFGCIEEGTIVYDQDYPEAPENIGGSGSGADRAPGDGAGSAGGTSDGSGSTGGSSDGSGVDGGATSTGSDGSTTGGDGSGDGSTGGSTGGSTSGGTGTDGGDTSTGSSDGSGSTGGSTDGGSGSGDTGGDTGSSTTGGDTSTGSDGGETGSGSSDGSGSTGGSTDGGSGDGSTGGSADGSGSDGSGSTGSTGGTDGGTTDGSGSGSTGGSSGGTTDGAGSTGGGTGTDGGDGGDGTDGDDSGSGTGDGSGTGGGDGAGDGGDGTDGGTEIDAPTVTLTAKEQKIVVTWSPVDNATSYNLTWVSSDGTENIIDVSAQQVADGADPIVFAHAPLVAGQNYTYTVTAVAADGKEAVGTPLTGSALALGCTPSTYEPEGLVAYYSFESDLSDSAGSYDLTPTGDSIAYSNGCVNGKAGHFDGDGGYAYNLDFNDENVDEVADGSWSISVWVNADEDMNKWSSVFSTTAVKDEFDTGADSWGEGFQLNVTDNMRPQLYGCREDHCDGSQKLTAPNALELNTWTHLAVTMDNGTANLYVNGENVGTYEGMITEFNRLKVGLNRRGQESWKGYIDELMVFGETLSADEVMSIYNNTLPGTPQNATATNWVGDTVVVGWEAVEGINEYNVYYSTGGTVNENSPYITVTGGTVVNFDNLTQGQDYTYAVAGVSPLGVGELSVPTTITVDGMLLADEPAFETTVDNTINGTARKAEAIEFSPDGSKMYLIIATWTGEGSFVQYDLATTWDPRTATRTERFQFCNASLNFGNTCFTNNLKFIADGRKLIGLNDASYNGIQSSIRVWDLDVAYDISTLNSEVDYTLETYDNTRVTHPAAFAFNPEGTRMIVGGYTRMGDIGISQEWELAGSYDFSTMTKLAETDGRYFRQGTSADTHQEIIWKADGTKFIILQDEGSVRTYNVSVPFELSSSVYGTESALTLDKEVIKFPYQSVRAIHFSPAQDRLHYVKDEADGTVTIGSMPFSW